jgi:ubiquinone/menaquinone biosynthesis C-methylase UbiE
MTQTTYEYTGLMAQSWDVFRSDTSEWADRFFYLEIIKQYGQPVLDIGCGTGRLLLDYHSQGIDIDGIDNSPEMLAICQAKAQQQGLNVQTYLQEMEALALPRSYKTILIPSSSFQLVTDPDLAAQTMRRIYAHLQPGGVVVAPLFALRNADDPLELTWEISAIRETDGATIKRFIHSRFDPVSECEDTEDRYQVVQDGVVIAEELHQRAQATRSYNWAQAQALFAQAGFVDMQAYKDFSFAPAQPDDKSFTLIGHKVGGG